MRDLERRVRRLERLRRTARSGGLHVVFLPDDYPEECDDPAVFLAACHADADGKQVVIVEFVPANPNT